MKRTLLVIVLVVITLAIGLGYIIDNLGVVIDDIMDGGLIDRWEVPTWVARILDSLGGLSFMGVVGVGGLSWKTIAAKQNVLLYSLLRSLSDGWGWKGGRVVGAYRANAMVAFFDNDVRLAIVTTESESFLQVEWFDSRKNPMAISIRLDMSDLDNSCDAVFNAMRLDGRIRFAKCHSWDVSTQCPLCDKYHGKPGICLSCRDQYEYDGDAYAEYP